MHVSTGLLPSQNMQQDTTTVGRYGLCNYRMYQACIIACVIACIRHVSGMYFSMLCMCQTCIQLEYKEGVNLPKLPSFQPASGHWPWNNLSLCSLWAELRDCVYVCTACYEGSAISPGLPARAGVPGDGWGRETGHCWHGSLCQQSGRDCPNPQPILPATQPGPSTHTVRPLAFYPRTGSSDLDTLT